MQLLCGLGLGDDGRKPFHCAVLGPFFIQEMNNFGAFYITASSARMNLCCSGAGCPRLVTLGFLGIRNLCLFVELLIVNPQHQAICYLITFGMRLLGNARTGPLFTDSYHCSQLLTKYAKEPHKLDRELWYAHQVQSLERIPKPAEHKNPTDPIPAQTPIHQAIRCGKGRYHFSCVISVNIIPAVRKHTEATACGIQYPPTTCHGWKLERIPGNPMTPQIP